MTLDEHVVRIRYEADLESFNKAIAIAERDTGNAVARMTRVLGGLHQPFDALFEQLSALQEAANAFTLPAEQITALETLTDRIAANTAVLNNNLKEIRDTASSLARDIEGALTPLSDPQLEKNLEALKELFEGSTGDDPAASLANRIAFGAAIAGLAGALAPGAAAVGVPLGFLVGFKLEEIVDAAASAIDAMMGLVSAEEQGVESADDLLNRFNTIVQQIDDWAAAQERVAKALADSAASLCTIAEKLETIKQNGGSLSICCESGGGKRRPQFGRSPFPRSGNAEPDGKFASGGRVFAGGAFLVGEQGPEIFVPDRAGRILPNSFLSSAGGGGLGGNLGGNFAGLTAEIERLGMAIEDALGELPEEFGFIAEAIEGPLNEALSGNIRSWEDLREAALGAAQEVLGGILQSEEVRAEIGELADVIDNVLNQALSGSIDSWGDLGRVALEVLQQIAEEILRTQLAAQGGGGGGGGIFGAIGSFLGIAGGFLGGGVGPTDVAGFQGGGLNFGGFERTSVPGGIGGFAAGGIPPVGVPSIVGERGPELFIPKMPGRILPNGMVSALNDPTLLRPSEPVASAPAQPVTIVIHQHFTINGRLTASERAETVSIARAAGQEAVSAQEREVSRGGNKAKLFGRRS